MKLKEGYLQAYQRIYDPEIYQQIKWPGITGYLHRIGQALVRERVFLCLAGFLAGRAVLLEEIGPFALAFWGVLFTTSPYKSFYVALSILAGGLTHAWGWHSLRLGLGLMLFTFMYQYLKSSRFRSRVPAEGLLPLAMLLAFIPQFILNYYLLYDLIILFFEISLGLLSWSVFKQIIPVLKGKAALQDLTMEKSVNLMLASIIMITGVGNLDLPLGNFQNIASKFAILIFGYLGGGGLGAAAGAVLGFIATLNLGEQYIYFIGLFALSGLLAGIFRELGKIGSVSGYISSSLLLSLYYVDYGVLTPLLLEDLVAIVVFLLLPRAWLDRLSLLHSSVKEEKQKQEVGNVRDDRLKYRDLTLNRIKDLAGVFDELAVTLNREEEIENNPRREYAKLVDKIEARVCRNCKLYRNCWKVEKVKIRKNLLELFFELEQKGRTSSQVTGPLLRQCYRRKEMAKIAGFLWEFYLESRAWKDNLYDGRELVSLQLQGASGVVKEISKKIKLEYQDPEEKRYNGQHLFTLELGLAQVPREGEGECGDSFGCFDTRDGHQAVILSDGMGSGESASRESKAAVNLMEKLLQVGLEKEVVIKMVNTALKLRMKETFSTVDLMLFNLQNGCGDFVKIGACPSYIKRDGAMKEIKGSSLPVGIVAAVEPVVIREKLRHGDLVVMITDGFTEMRGGKASEAWVKDTLSGLKEAHPQIVADSLLEKACQYSGNRARDDFSVAVCRVVRLRGKGE